MGVEGTVKGRLSASPLLGTDQNSLGRRTRWGVSACRAALPRSSNTPSTAEVSVSASSSPRRRFSMGLVSCSHCRRSSATALVSLAAIPRGFLVGLGLIPFQQALSRWETSFSYDAKKRKQYPLRWEKEKPYCRLYYSSPMGLGSFLRWDSPLALQWREKGGMGGGRAWFLPPQQGEMIRLHLYLDN